MITDADREELQKSAAVLRRKFAATEKRADAGGLMGLWAGLSDSQKKIIRDSLIGMALGGTVGAVGGAGTAAPDESRMSAALRYGLLGAGAGAVTGGAGRTAIEALGGGVKLPGEGGRAHLPVSDRILDASTQGLLANTGLAVGGGVGGTAAWKMLGLKAKDIQQWQRAGRHEDVERILRQAAQQPRAGLMTRPGQAPADALQGALAELGGIKGTQGPLGPIVRGIKRRQLLRNTLSRTPEFLEVGGRLPMLAGGSIMAALLGRGLQRYIQGKDV